jgi:hypothetical protein
MYGDQMKPEILGSHLVGNPGHVASLDSHVPVRG